MTMLEKAARALCGWTPNVTSWADICENPRDAEALRRHYHNQVLAVLQAIRTADEAMIEAGAGAYEWDYEYGIDSEDTGRVWTAMIDSVIGEAA